MRDINIGISSFPCSGGSTLALLIAALLGHQYVYAGSLMKYLAQQMYEGNLNKFEEEHGDTWDYLWETYREHKLATANGVLMEGKTIGFLQQDKSNLFTIMVSADFDTCVERAGTDNRAEGRIQLAERRRMIRERWLRQFGFDFFDEGQIGQHYNLHIENSKKTIEESLEEVFNAMAHDQRFDPNMYYFPDLVRQIPDAVKNYWAHGKGFYRKILQERNLWVSSQEVLHEWNELFAKELVGIPENMREQILKYN